MRKWITNVSIIIAISILSVPCRGREFHHVFTSKGIYETCEDMWFKCVAFDDGTLRVSDRSHTAYVEIVNSADSVVWKEKYRMSNGMCDGHVYVGEDWQPGEYRMFVHTRSSLGREDTVVYPKRLLIVNELPQVPEFLKTAKERVGYIDIPDSTMTGSRLNVAVTLDSAEYHTRSKVRATVKVTDTDGNPVRAVLAMSVADALYSYPLTDVDIQSQVYGVLGDSVRIIDKVFEPVISDAVVSGYLRSGNKKNIIPFDGQFINVFDDVAEKGTINITNTGDEGYFEVSPEMGSSLGRTLLIKPLVVEDMKPRLEFEDPFKNIYEIRKDAIEKTYPIIRRLIRNEVEDTMDYSERHLVQLDEIVVKGKGNRFPKRNKVMGYLDSLALNLETAWICGCRSGAGQSGTYLNDYIEGYTHHPGGSGHPKKIGKPKRGVVYELIKYSGPTMNDYVVDIQYMEYQGPRYSEEELLKMNGLWKTEGYYAKRRFQIPSDDDLITGVEDFRNTLLWLPRAQTDDNGEFSITIPTSNVKSTFKLQVLIITDNVRDMKTETEYFKVI